MKKPKIKKSFVKKIVISLASFVIVLFIIPYILYIVSPSCTLYNTANYGYRKTQLTSDEEKELQTLQKSLKNFSQPEDSSFLTFPEWHIVYSAEEYADFLKHNKPSQFPYAKSIAQYWCSYRTVSALTKNIYKYNSDDQLMLSVIGVSYTYEYAFKGLYENTIGRVSEFLGSTDTEEDRYAAVVAHEYGYSLPHSAWYNFPFGPKLIGLWTETSFFGPHFLRKIERKFALSLEYSIKATYGWAIKNATESTYSPEATEIYLVTEDIPTELLQKEPRIKIIKNISNETTLVSLPRYDEFNTVILKLAAQNVRILRIGDNANIMVSLIAPKEWNYHLSKGKPLFSIDVPTNSRLKKIAVNIPVVEFSSIINKLHQEKIKIEHIYDY